MAASGHRKHSLRANVVMDFRGQQLGPWVYSASHSGHHNYYPSNLFWYIHGITVGLLFHAFKCQVIERADYSNSCGISDCTLFVHHILLYFKMLLLMNSIHSYHPGFFFCLLPLNIIIVMYI